MDVTKEIMMNYFHKSVRTEEELKQRQFRLNIKENINQESKWLINWLKTICQIGVFGIVKGMGRHWGDSCQCKE